MDFEKMPQYEELGPHAYKLTYTDGTEQEVKMIWAKTNSILKIIMGMGADIKSGVLAFLEGDKQAALEAIIQTFSRQMIENFFDEANQIACIALNEYGPGGKLIKVGDTSMMLPEDVFLVMSMVLTDVTGLLKNALGRGQEMSEETQA